jgi:predicted Zn-dependent protease
VIRAARTPRPTAARRAGLLGLSLLLLAGCVGEEKEQEIGDRLAGQLNATVPLVQDPALTHYVNQLGLLIARNSERPDLQYRFYIIDTDAVNAFALPGGHVYVNRGLVERTRDVSELSAVLAHEIGHVAARHGARNLQRQMRTGSVVSVLYEMILGREPEILDQDALRLGPALWTARNSRADEQEADRLAVDYLVAAGVEPDGMVSFLARLEAEERAAPPTEEEIAWLATHPTTAERVAATRRHIDAVRAAAPPGLARDNASYPGFLARLRALPRTMPFPLDPGPP